MPTALITGASTGIGLAAARYLAARGWHVFAAARTPTAIPPADNVTPLELDVTDDASITAAASLISQRTEGLSALVNNAGIAVSGPLECLPADDLRRQFDVNVLGTAAVTRAFLPLLRAHAKSATHPTTIATLSSVSGLVSFPFLGAYAASKFALEAMADALRIELAPWHIRVALIEPGPVATPIWAKARTAGDAQRQSWAEHVHALYPAYCEQLPKQLAESERHAVPVDVVSRAIYHALTAKRARTRYPLGPGSRLARLRKFFPDRWWDALVRRRLNP